MKYKVGDKVRIRHDLSADGEYVAEEMTLYAGKEATITKACPANGAYTIDLDEEYYWYSSAFEDVNETDKTINPDYYKFHGYDVFDIADYFGLSFPLGNAIKYILRHKDETKRLEDLKKARQCLDRAIELMEKKELYEQDEDAVQDLETCPFCGGEARYRMGTIGFGTYCNKCGAEVLFRPKGDLICGEEGNREAWNRRAEND